MNEQGNFPRDPYSIIGDGSWRECVQRTPGIDQHLIEEERKAHQHMSSLGIKPNEDTSAVPQYSKETPGQQFS